MSDGVNTWIADNVAGSGGPCQIDNNNGNSTCFYHANSIAGTSATLTVVRPTGDAVGYAAAYIYEVSGGPLTEEVGAGQGYSTNAFSQTVDTPSASVASGLDRHCIWFSRRLFRLDHEHLGWTYKRLHGSSAAQRWCDSRFKYESAERIPHTERPVLD